MASSSSRIKKTKIALIISAGILLLFDVVFVLDNPYPTISKIILFSSPKYLIFIWMWGLFSANLFFYRIGKHVFVSRIHGIIANVVIGIGLLILGLSIHEPTVPCNELSAEIPVYMEHSCRIFQNNKLVDCGSINCSFTRAIEQPNGVSTFRNEAGKDVKIKYDLRIEYKLLLILFGCFCGFYLTPQRL